MSCETPTDWEQLPDNPDPVQDLGYAGADWDVIAVEQRGTEHRLFLPPEDEYVWSEEFLIADTELVCDAAEMR